MMWLCYKLNQKSHKEIINLNNFYTHYIDKNIEYSMHIYKFKKYTKNYSNFKQTDTKKELMDIKDIPIFYDAFIFLCRMNIYLDVNNQNATIYFVKHKEFVETHKYIFNGKINDNKGKSYNKKLSYLSKCYDIFKNSSLYLLYQRRF
ncbi:Plasmodium variant antigen protein Cir/Yir/Bir, putative [Plasmodium berghei]|uniref:Plasmodium variant antigen protein Cir/Yir/Bir, putative n=1 Tax=Plasmodium berghei TaxID=5821 RepID=A0A122HQC3_PLABE|nr:Plasmodium variant antigen protein Cir/Yir/Bir, putative [Plasmodium berghei]SCL89837.1 Plasmodium variant antigen protein Cir/Yir/Bir, putative [Plasmodium berghei]SCM15164.1 Plasmodium variant antigen protein Cir/Yir/Bir, putative [Plasmodium berghei]SCM16959.1 Plasmodium variant antigen protein Cir/Yir/Bir, putative [Plasmodium berghei]SCN21764.1 Plasmodium variant antigen protein Cir/Yir/Bir, putative [Plasmodium berghei]